MDKVIALVVVVGLILVFVFGVGSIGSGDSASEIEAMTRYEMVRGQNRVNLVYARGDVFNQQIILFSMVLCAGSFVLLVVAGVFLVVLGGWGTRPEMKRDHSFSIGGLE